MTAACQPERSAPQARARSRGAASKWQGRGIRLAAATYSLNARPPDLALTRPPTAVYFTLYMEIETTIARHGNSLTVCLPSALARELGLRDGDRVTLRKSNSGILIVPPQRSRLAARLATVRACESEVGTGRAIEAESLE